MAPRCVPREASGAARSLLEFEPALHELRAALLDGSWRLARAHLRAVRDPKPRTISVAPFRNRVAHQVLASVLVPRLERRLVTDTYACRTGKGTHAALARARAWART
jgi:RNA-directed DNA polymerase